MCSVMRDSETEGSKAQTDPSMPTLGHRPQGRPPGLAGCEQRPHLGPGGSLPYLQHVRSSLQVSLNPSLLATNRIREARYSTRSYNKQPPYSLPLRWRERGRGGKIAKEKIQVFHTGMLSGQERKFNFLGTRGPPDTVETDTPRVRLLPSFPCYTKSSPEEETTFLSSPQKPWLLAHMAQMG